MALTTVKSDQIQTSVALAGSPTTTTQSASDNSTKVATTAYVETAVANLVASAPAALNTLDELAAALNDDASFSTTVTNSIATKLPLAGGSLTGAVTSSANISTTGSATKFISNSSSSGDYIRIYAGSGTGKWDIYGNGANLRFSDNDGAGGVYFDREIGIRNAPDSNYALKLLQNQSLTHGGYFQINGGTATGLEINATSGSFSGTALYVRESSVTTGGYLARFANSAGDKVTIATDGTLTVPTLITGAYGAGGSAGDGFRLNSTDLYGQVDASDKVRIAVAGDSFFNGGNVGIGTTPNATRLDVTTTLANNFAARFINSNTTDSYGISVSAGTDANDYTANFANRVGTSLMRVRGDGNVGIGTSSPGQKLTVAGGIESQASQGNVAFYATTAGSYNQQNAASGTAWAYGATAGNAAPNTAASTSFGFHHWNGSAWSNPVTFRNTGDVGIGTSNPAQALEVVKSGFAYVRTRSTSSGFTGFDIGQHSGGNIYLNNRDNTDIIFQTNNSERMRINNAGVVTKPNQPYFQANGSGAAWTTVTSENAWNYGIHNNTASYWGEGTDRGAGYFNPSNGRFTAPVTGWYTFQCSIYVKNTNGVEGAYLHPQFFRNGVLAYQNGKSPYKIVQTKTTSNPEYMFVAWSENIYLTATQYVTVNVYFRSQGTWQHYPDYSVFTGGLIS